MVCVCVYVSPGFHSQAVPPEQARKAFEETHVGVCCAETPDTPPSHHMVPHTYSIGP